MSEDKKIIVDDKEMSLQDAQAILDDASTNKPTEEEINEATKEFNKQAAAFNSKLFKIGPPEKADAIYDFLLQTTLKGIYIKSSGRMSFGVRYRANRLYNDSLSNSMNISGSLYNLEANSVHENLSGDTKSKPKSY